MYMWWKANNMHSEAQAHSFWISTDVEADIYKIILKILSFDCQ